MGHEIKPTVCKGCTIPKGWGEELIIENNEKLEFLGDRVLGLIISSILLM